LIIIYNKRRYYKASVPQKQSFDIGYSILQSNSVYLNNAHTLLLSRTKIPPPLRDNKSAEAFLLRHFLHMLYSLGQSCSAIHQRGRGNHRKQMLAYIQIFLAVILGILVLIQHSEGSLGAAFGGGSLDSGSTTRRGPELWIFRITIVVACLFVAAAVLNLIY
jgi:protein translocase SecG subunit